MAAREKRQNSGRLFAIGDLHGCPDELAAMLKAIAPGRGDTVVFVGDYVDRGPSARDVVDVVLDLAQSEAELVCLKGNHEDMMLSFLGLPGHYGESFIMNGGDATLKSYGVLHEDPGRALEQIPGRHVEFFKSLALSYYRPPYLFVHAGIMPTRQLEEQDPEAILWIREEFILSQHKLGATVVFGHTPMRGVMVDLPYKLGIDTGLVYGGRLTCVEFAEGVIYQVARRSSQVKARALVLE